MDELEISGRRYISSRRAARAHRYHSDYIGQLLRSGKVAGVKVGRAWYVDEASLVAYLNEEATGQPAAVGSPQPIDPQPSTPEPVQFPDPGFSPPPATTPAVQSSVRLRYISEDQPFFQPIAAGPAAPRSSEREPVRPLVPEDRSASSHPRPAPRSSALFGLLVFLLGLAAFSAALGASYLLAQVRTTGSATASLELRPR